MTGQSANPMTIKPLPNATPPRFQKPFERFAGRSIKGTGAYSTKKLSPGRAPEVVSQISTPDLHETAAEAA